MKVILLLIGLSSFSSMAQFTIYTYSEGELDYERNEFPVVESEKNPKAAERINDFLHSAELGVAYSETDSNRFEQVLPPEGEIWGESNFEFAVLTNNPFVFSIEIMSVYTGAYSEGYSRYYNFNARTGEHITMYDVFKADSLGAVRDIVNEACIDTITTYLAQMDRDLDEYGEEQWEMYNDCLWRFTDIDDIYAANFFFTDSCAVFVRSRCSNHAMRALDDLWEFTVELDFEKLNGYFTKNGENLIEGKEWSQEGIEFPRSKVMYGKVHTYPITMILEMDPEGYVITGKYWYDKQNKPIALQGSIDPDGTIYLSEFHGEESKRSMKGKYENGVFTGEWLLTRKSPNWKVSLTLE